MRHQGTPPLPPSKICRVLRLVGWNAVLLVAGLALIGLVGEAWLRLTTPFLTTSKSVRFVPEVGVLSEPDTEERHTNGLDFWTVSRTNSLGFLDREPVSPERAAESCHVTVIGDSFVKAREVPIPDKFHVRLEELVARELPSLDVTTSAFGQSNTAQASQLPYYDKYARRLSPKLVVLVFVGNDFGGNSATVMALRQMWDPDKAPYAYPQRTADGTIKLRPPHPDFRNFFVPPGYSPRFGTSGFDIRSNSSFSRANEWGTTISYFWNWLNAKINALPIPRFGTDSRLIAKVELLRRRSPRRSPLLNGWRPSMIFEDRSSIAREALDFTAFALDQFKERAERDGFSLVILSTESVGTRGDLFDLISGMAEARGIPVIDLYDYILRQGGRVKDARWPHNGHWNPTGHRWAAEALLDYLKQHPTVCTGSTEL